jgi:phosphatidate cytidylyltransferase
MTKERILIAIAGFALFLGLFWVDYHFTTHLGSLIVLTAIGSLALYEFYGLLQRMGLDPDPVVGVGAAVALFLTRGILHQAHVDPLTAHTAVGCLFCGVIAFPFIHAMFRHGPKNPGGREDFDRAGATLLGLLYVWFFLSFALELRLLGDEALHQGLKLSVILVLSAKLGDSAAYLVGRTIGSRPLIWVSPKKTWEGVGGSILGSMVSAVVLGILMGFGWWQMAILGFVISIAGQLGDLVESLIKRRAGVKDSGTLLKEMGGFLDLVDSLLFAAPVAYLSVLALGV